MLMDSENNQCFIIDVAIPGVARVIEKEMQKVKKYQDLRWELGGCGISRWVTSLW